MMGEWNSSRSRREGKGAGDAVAVEDERVVRQPERGPVVEVLVEPALDPPIDGRQVIRQEPVGLPLVREQGVDHVGPLLGRLGGGGDGGQSQGGQAEVDVLDGLGVRPIGRGVTDADTGLQFFRVHGTG